MIYSTFIQISYMLKGNHGERCSRSVYADPKGRKANTENHVESLIRKLQSKSKTLTNKSLL
jgi:hypothetical protein